MDLSSLYPFNRSVGFVPRLLRWFFARCDRLLAALAALTFHGFLCRSVGQSLASGGSVGATRPWAHKGITTLTINSQCLWVL